MNSPHRAAGLLLAAGGASRFAAAGTEAAAGTGAGAGAHKLLADLDGEPVVRRCARSLLEAGLEPVLAVLGARDREIADAIAGLGVEIVLNGNWTSGMGGSIARGIARLRETSPTRPVLIALADMPLLAASDHQAVLAAHDWDDPNAITRGAAERPGHPVVFGPDWFDKLGALSGDRGAMAVAQSATVRHVPLQAATQWDVDTPSALEAVRARSARS